MCPFHQPEFFFGPNFNFGVDSVFTQRSSEYSPTPPPVEGYFLLLDNSNFLLLDGEDLTLL